MGIELDVLVGHPEHELMFLASRVAEAAGLANPQTAVYKAKETFIANGQACRIADLIPLLSQKDSHESLRPNEKAKRWREMWLFSESAVYQMLLRGHSPRSEPFRRWVTEEVLPTIRKTGRYDASESSNPIAQGIMDELKALRGELVELKEIVKALLSTRI